ncbi:MAG TPA: dihydroorotase, partial [Alphaproteobacteria bacterium]|nr:dihydroorotase [Alphaproteobacteria bacterium]
MKGAGPRAFICDRIVDPESGYDGPGAILAESGVIKDIGPKLFADGVPEGIDTVDCRGQVLAPGLIDMRVTLYESGETHKENLQTASQAAITGGITTMAVIQGSDQAIETPAQVEYLISRGREAGLTDVRPYGGITRGAEGTTLTEMGLLAEAGAVGFTEG